MVPALNVVKGGYRELLTANTSIPEKNASSALLGAGAVATNLGRLILAKHLRALGYSMRVSRTIESLNSAMQLSL